MFNDERLKDEMCEPPDHFFHALTPPFVSCGPQQEMPTGEVEVLAESVEVFNVCRKLPFEIKDFVKVSGTSVVVATCPVGRRP